MDSKLPAQHPISAPATLAHGARDDGAAPARLLSRRRLLGVSGATLAGGAALVLAACGPAEDDEHTPEDDAEALNGLLAAEEKLAGIYSAGASASGPLRQAVDRFALDNAGFVRSLRERVSELGGEPAAAAEGMVAGTGVRPLLIGENEALAAAIAAIGDLSSGELRREVQEIATAHAAHAAVYADAEGEELAASAFVMGEEPGS